MNIEHSKEFTRTPSPWRGGTVSSGGVTAHYFCAPPPVTGLCTSRADGLFTGTCSPLAMSISAKRPYSAMDDEGDTASLLDTSSELPPWDSLFTAEELQAAIKIFTIYAENESYKKHARHNPDIATLFKTARSALIASEDELKDRRRRRKKDRKDSDNKVLAVTGIRQMRNVKMVGYLGGSVDIPLPPRIATKEANEEFAKLEDERDRPVPTDRLMLEEGGDEGRNGGDGPSAQPAPEGEPSQPADDMNDPAQPRPRKLNFSRTCHVCGQGFKILHHFYDQMCPSCAKHNFEKRFSEADMRGRVCIVTGARVKVCER